jgi:hypothetical protein
MWYDPYRGVVRRQRVNIASFFSHFVDVFENGLPFVRRT